jgi:hypothetical protein
MKLQKIVRVQMVLMGLGVALLLASSAYAQQDMDPTDFPINPGTVKVERHATQQTAQAIAPAKQAPAEGVVSAALFTGPSTQEESDFSRLVIVDAGMIVILMLGVTGIVLYAKAATKRERRLQPILSDGPYSSVSGATTH